jgi:hypothetical protein
MILVHLAMVASVPHGGSAPSSHTTWIIDGFFFGGGLLLGRLWGRRTGLKHLGEAEFNTRWRNVRGLRRF